MLQVETEITKLLRPGSICVGLRGATKDEILESMLDTLEGHPAVIDLEKVREDVASREKIMSTGVGQGLGLPHAKTAGVTETMAVFAVTEEPIEFRAIDDEPVRLLFMLLGPETSRSQHIKVLSRISRLMNRHQIRDALLAARSPDEVVEILSDGELDLMDR
ncbi:MAG: PTS sugar transporter subunit IIA [Rhodothermales bacterium]|nr:PTS sugar transporter subunit IIA [Rhodothermales bacterium]